MGAGAQRHVGRGPLPPLLWTGPWMQGCLPGALRRPLRVVPHPFHLGEEAGRRSDLCHHLDWPLSLGKSHFTGNSWGQAPCRAPLGANLAGLLPRVQMEARLQGACRSRPRRSRLPFWGPNVPTDPRLQSRGGAGTPHSAPGGPAQGRTWLSASWGRRWSYALLSGTGLGAARGLDVGSQPLRWETGNGGGAPGPGGGAVRGRAAPVGPPPPPAVLAPGCNPTPLVGGGSPSALRPGPRPECHITAPAAPPPTMLLPLLAALAAAAAAWPGCEPSWGPAGKAGRAAPGNRERHPGGRPETFDWWSAQEGALGSLSAWRLGPQGAAHGQLRAAEGHGAPASGSVPCKGRQAGHRAVGA